MAMANRATTPTTTTPLTLDQLRAADAWRCALKSQTKEYANLAKGLPALIMNSGLLQVMAFLKEKGSGGVSQRHCLVLGDDLRAWLHRRFPEVPVQFEGFMEAVMKADSRKYQAITAESLAWLRWLRQLAAALIP
jgi:CRISPR-associated protein Cmr5